MAYELKTKQNDLTVSDFLNKIEDEQKRKDCFAVVDMMQEVSGFPPKMWGTAIVGFGSYHYKYASGHEGDSCLIGFSPRKANITMYFLSGVVQVESLTKDLGKFKTGKGCLYINKLADVNEAALKNLMKQSLEKTKEFHATK